MFFKPREPRAATKGVDEIVAWFNRPREPRLDAGRALELYNTLLPRVSFLKMLPPAARVADIGAGDGSLSVFRRWPAPERPDLRMHAYSIEKAPLFEEYEGYEVSDWNLAPPGFAGLSFDALVCAHFIEHIAKPASLAAWAGEHLKPGGRAYIEWPSPLSLDLPPRTVLEAAGVPLVISRFDDDRTHRRLPDRDAMIRALRRNGFRIEVAGIIRLPWLEEELLAHFRDADDGFPRQAAFWSYTGWSQYIIAERARRASAAPRKEREPCPIPHGRPCWPKSKANPGDPGNSTAVAPSGLATCAAGASNTVRWKKKSPASPSTSKRWRSRIRAVRCSSPPS